MTRLYAPTAALIRRLAQATLGLLLLCSPWVGAQPAYVLDDNRGSIRLQGSIAYLSDENNNSQLDDILKQKHTHFVPATTKRSMPLHERNTVWVRISLERAPASTADWTLALPLPYLDFAALYQPDGKGSWTRQIAGDTVAVGHWSRPALYPDFRLDVPAAGPYEVYLELRNFKPTLLPILVATEGRRDSQRELEHLLLGGLFGALLMLVGVCAIHYLQSRTADDGWYTLYAGGMVVVVSCMSGISGLWLWPYSPAWSNYTHLSMPILGLAATLVFVRQMTSLDAGFPRLSQVVYGMAGFGIPVALLGVAVDRSLADLFNAAYLGLCPILLLVTTVQTWRRGHAVGRWLTIAYLPTALVTAYIAMQMLQLLPAWWQSRYLMVVAVALSVPLLQQALHLRARERRDVLERANALPTQDALTGLLTRPLFDTQVDLAIKRSRQHKEPSAIVMVEVVNYNYLRESYGAAIAEQCLLRAAVKLHRVLRDVDPAGRIDIARFGLVLDGVSSRQDLTERMVRLVASGLIPLPGLHPEVTLQFHISCALLTETVSDPRTILQELSDMLHSMSPRTRRPIRFLEPSPTLPENLSRTAQESDRPGLDA